MCAGNNDKLEDEVFCRCCSESNQPISNNLMEEIRDDDDDDEQNDEVILSINCLQLPTHFNFIL